MRISLAHSTTFRYDGPVVLEPHVFRLRPREDGTQRLIQYQLDISPAPAGRSLFIDQDGNVAEQAWFNGPLRELLVRSMFQIETLRVNPFDFLLPSSAALQLPLVYPAAERVSLAPYLSESPEMAEFAKSVASRAEWQTMPFLERLVRELFENFEHVFREEGAPLSPQQTHRERRSAAEWGLRRGLSADMRPSPHSRRTLICTRGQRYTYPAAAGEAMIPLVEWQSRPLMSQ
jgi:hypothetical protein